MKNTIQFKCSEHGIQKFAAFSGHAQITLWCGCTWYSDGKLKYRERYKGIHLEWLQGKIAGYETLKNGRLKRRKY